MNDITHIREALANLTRAPNHRPGEAVALDDFYIVRSHRAALDLERPVVVGNRGMGKSFWAHALLNPEIRERLAEKWRVPAASSMQVVFGFNASERNDGIAPPPAILAEAAKKYAALSLWRAVLARAAAEYLGEALPDRFAAAVEWVTADAERYSRLLTRADDLLQSKGQKLLVLFDALDRLGSDWATVRERIQGLLELTLATQSFRAIRVKLFLRRDQASDPRLFAFPDASKLLSTWVELSWESTDLYSLLFQKLRITPAFHILENKWFFNPQALVEELTGPYMGKTSDRGYVYTWLPTHLADALGQISPRTFLTAWREAACHGSCPTSTPVDYHGILEGVRRASEDRLAELSQDYPWVRTSLEPLRGQSVPLEQNKLTEIWRSADTFNQVMQQSVDTDKPVLIPSSTMEGSSESILLDALKLIGVVEVRKNGKVDVPDIFRVEAGIKRRGGVKPPRRIGNPR